MITIQDFGRSRSSGGKTKIAHYRVRQELMRRVQRGDVREPPLRAPSGLNGCTEPLHPSLGLGGVGREPRVPARPTPVHTDSWAPPGERLCHGGRGRRRLGRVVRPARCPAGPAANGCSSVWRSPGARLRACTLMLTRSGPTIRPSI
jgi:hypothetical protein